MPKGILLFFVDQYYVGNNKLLQKFLGSQAPQQQEPLYQQDARYIIGWILQWIASFFSDK